MKLHKLTRQDGFSMPAEFAPHGGCLMICEKDGQIVDCLPAVPQTSKDRPKIMVRPVNVKRLLLLLE